MKLKKCNLWNVDYRLFYWVAVFVLLMFYMLRPVNFYLADTLYNTIYPIAAFALIIFFFIFNRQNIYPEGKLLILYWMWLLVSRLLNGGISHSQDKDLLLNMALTCVVFPVCIVLCSKKRQFFLDLINWVICVYHTAFGVICIYTAVYQLYLVNPITGATLCSFIPDYGRLAVLDHNPNICALWFFLGFFAAVNLFFRYRKKWLRAVVVLFAIVNYITLALTFSRNVMLSFSSAIALLTAMIAIKVLPLCKMRHKIVVCVIVVLFVLPLSYVSFGITTRAVGQVSEILMPEEISIADAGMEEAVNPGGALTTEDIYGDSRGLVDTGRLPIYRSAITTFQREPMRLLMGCPYKYIMSISNAVTVEAYAHFHNSYIECLVMSGIPGLLIVLAFCVLLAIRCVKLFFSEASMAEKVLILPLVGYLCYNIFETNLFSRTDFRSLPFFIVAGAVVAYTTENSKTNVI